MRKCAICEKGSVMGGKRKLLRGHYNLVKRERKYPNLQWLRLPAEGSSAHGRRVKACVQCIKSRTKAEKIRA